MARFVLHESARRFTELHSELTAPPRVPISLDLEFDSGGGELRLSLVQLQRRGGRAHVLDVVREPRFLPALALWLDPAHVEFVVLHGGRQDLVALRTAGVDLGKLRVLDTQVAHEVLTSERQRALHDVVRYWLGNEEVERLLPSKTSKEIGAFMRRNAWLERPLPQFVLDYAADDVLALGPILDRMWGAFKDQAQRDYAMQLSADWQLHKRSQLERSSASAPPPPAPAPAPAPATATAPAPPPPAATARQRRKLTASQFGRYLAQDAALCARCRDREAFTREFAKWKAGEKDAGQACSGSPSDMLFWLVQDSSPGAARVRLGRRGAMTVSPTDVPVGGAQARAALAIKALREQPSNKGGVVVDADVRLEHDQQSLSDAVLPAGKESAAYLLVNNNSGKTRRTLREVKVVCRDKILVCDAPVPCELVHGRPLRLPLRVRPQAEGRSVVMVVLDFESFAITRTVEVRCGDDPELARVLAPQAPFQRQRRRRANVGRYDAIVAAPRPRVRQQRARGGAKLEDFPLGKSGVLGMLERDEVDERLFAGREVLKTEPRPRDALAMYTSHFKHMLFVEEAQLKSDLADFDLADDLAVALKKRDGLLWVAVPGLVEGRPSVLVGDNVLLSDRGGGEGKGKGKPSPAASNKGGKSKRVAYEGVAERIELESVGLRVDPEFERNYRTGQLVDVRFLLNRRGLRLMHQGLQNVAELRVSTLFPDVADLRVAAAPRAEDPLRAPFNRHLNAEQRQAVEKVVRGTSRNVPYIIFGPPGTGKTTTVVEIVLQSARKCGLKVLVCAPTNTAADVVATKLYGGENQPLLGGKNELLRLVAYSRRKSEVEGVLPLKLTNWSDEVSCFDTPELQRVLETKVVVATLATAASLHNLGVRRGHFDLIVVDEAGQAQEPEAIAAAACLLGPDSQLVVAGDPQQLGPVIHAPLSREYGLGVSLLERLMLRGVYTAKPAGAAAAAAAAAAAGSAAEVVPVASLAERYDPDVITMLQDNYRSNEQLLELPNQLFYGGRLRACADAALVDSCLGWEGLPNPKTPLMWLGVQGKEEREASSPSWFNPEEAVAVVRIVRELLQMRLNKPRPEDIGIITPYNKQVHKITQGLESKNIRGVKVGSTELFQGQERRIIVISCVRSNPELVESDRRHLIGFISNPKRFNVAITRAQACLIVVGNPALLATDDQWGELLRMAVRKKAYKGVSIASVAPAALAEVSAADDAAVDDLADELESVLRLAAHDPVDQDDNEPRERLPVPSFEQ